MKAEAWVNAVAWELLHAMDMAKKKNSLLILLFFRAVPMAYGVPRLGVELELQLLAYATATATQGPSYIRDLHHSSRQCRVLNQLSEGRD